MNAPTQTGELLFSILDAYREVLLQEGFSRVQALEACADLLGFMVKSIVWGKKSENAQDGGLGT